LEPLYGVGERAFEFVSAAGFVQVYSMASDKYFEVTIFNSSALS
jgi:hypothetical protein